MASLLQWRKLRAALGGWADWPKVTQPIDGGTKGPNCQLVLSPLFLLIIILPKKIRFVVARLHGAVTVHSKHLAVFWLMGCAQYISRIQLTIIWCPTLLASVVVVVL